jgi:hypothetical protein
LLTTYSNPKDYADNQDARQFDKRLRPPIRQVELDIDPNTGMKNYIANERGDWATSAAYVKYSLSRSIHFGRMYTNGGHRHGKDEDLYEALRCLGQALHTLEDFGAHSNYCELSLHEMGFHSVFPHTGSATQMNIRGHHVFPIVTGTFGMVDFFHSVLGEANDHFAQSELNEMDNTLGNAANSSSSSGPLNALTGLLGKIPGTKDLVREAEDLKRMSEAQDNANRSHNVRSGYTSSRTFGDEPDQFEQPRGFEQETGFDQSQGYEQGHGFGHRGPEMGGFSQHGQFDAPPPSFPASAPSGNKPGPGLPGLPDFDAQKTIKQIYPILEFRDKVVRFISSIIEKIPGLEALVEKITETVTLFVFSLLAPFIRPIINAAAKSLQTGSAGVVESSGKHQYEPWTDPTCTDPTHSLLSKDHFSNVLNEPAGKVAAAILRYVVPRVMYAWQHVDVPVDQVMDDCVKVFHHPVLRDMHNEAHRSMYEAVQGWVHSRSDRGHGLNDILSADGVRAGRNLKDKDSGHGAGQSHGGHSHGGGGFPALGGLGGGNYGHGQHHQQSQHHGGGSSMPWDQLGKLPIPGMSDISNVANKLSGLSNLIPGGLSRDGPGDGDRGREDDFSTGYQQAPSHPPPSGEYGGYSHPAQQQPPHYESGFNLPPPSGYEQYHQNRPEGQRPIYQPAEHGSHTQDYYEQSGYGRNEGYNHSQGQGYGQEPGYGQGGTQDEGYGRDYNRY